MLPSMSVKTLRITLLLFFASVIQGRVLRLNTSDDDLISDGIDHVEDYSSSLGLSAPNNCDHQYGFLPCAENAAGYIFQIMVYQGLLIFGEKQIGKGSKVMFNIIGAGKFGGIIFRILMSLPSMILMIVSGVFSPKENAQSQVSLGVGIFAGMTVFSLTIQWGMCLIVGRRNFLHKSATDQTTVSNSICLQAKEKLTQLKETGVTIDSDTNRTAGIMLLSLIPYIIVQLDDIFNNSAGNGAVNLIALCVSSLSLLLYFAYQIFNPWIQERSLDYSKYELLRKGFLQHMKQHGQLVTDNGKLNTEVITKLFSDTDKNADKNITKVEMEKLVLDIIQTGKVEVDESYAVSEVMKTFDFNDDRSITEQEFINGCKRWIEETNQSSNTKNASSKYIFHELCQLFKDKKEDDPQEIDRIMSKILMHCETQLLKSEALVTPDGKPNIERIKTLFKKFDSDGNKSISMSELHQLISTVKFGDFKPKYEDVVKELFKDFDTDGNSIIDEPEFVEGVTKWLNKAIRVAESRDTTKSIDKFDEMVWEKKAFDKWALIISVFQVLLGILMLTFLGGPLMGSILQLSFAMNLPSFSISFVVVPLAMNARSLITALLPASHKSERTASLTFSEIYGGVVMNNLAGLLTLLAIVYAKDLTFDFAAEVMTIMVVCSIIGILAYLQKTYPLWTSILAFLLYPFSLGLFYFMQISWRWN